MDPEKVATIALMFGLFAGGGAMYLWGKCRVELLQSELECVTAELAKSKVSLAASVATPEALQVYMVTRAALDIAYPGKQSGKLPAVPALLQDLLPVATLENPPEPALSPELPLEIPWTPTNSLTMSAELPPPTSAPSSPNSSSFQIRSDSSG